MTGALETLELSQNESGCSGNPLFRAISLELHPGSAAASSTVRAISDASRDAVRCEYLMRGWPSLLERQVRGKYSVGILRSGTFGQPRGRRRGFS